MNKFLLRVLPLFTLVVLLSNCRKKEWDEYYKRPENLEPPIYQQLQAKGNFKNLLACIDKAGYTQTLNSAGYWTFFAPNDEAFAKFFQEKGIAGVDKIDSAAARAMVQYLLVYNAFKKETIDDYQSSTGWVVDLAFRRRTAYYTGFYNDTMQDGQVVKAIQSNRNGNGVPYVIGDNNNKYIPYFTDVYFRGRDLSAADYNYFYPATQYGGFNVADAKVVNQDIVAENGVIHELDRVVTPLASIDDYLRSKPEYSEFKRLYDKYMVSFMLNESAGNRYKLLTGENKQVYVKAFNSLLAFSLNNENYLKLQDNDGQQNSWTIFVPKNDVLLDYEKKVLLEYYGSFDNTPSSIVVDFLNAHMWQTQVWPSKFNSTLNFAGEEARFDPQADVVDRKVLSNGMFYGTNKVQESNVFSSVYAKAYLDPKYSIMLRLLNVDMKYNVSFLGTKFTMFMMPDAVLRSWGYDFNTSTGKYTYTAPGTTTTSSDDAVRLNLLRILNTSVIPGELSNLSGSGIAESFNNEYIKWNNNQVITAGTMDSAKTVRVDSVKTTKNGIVYYLNGLLTFSSAPVSKHIISLGGTSTSSDFNYFANYLINSGVYIAGTGEILGISAGTFYTVFVPSNSAIMQAVKDGVLPGNRTTGAPNFTATSWTATDKESVNRFIYYHILNKKTLIPDGKESDAFETLLKNASGEALKVTVLSSPGSMQITDMKNSRANVIVAKSNNLSNRTVIHLIDNYLKFTY